MKTLEPSTSANSSWEMLVDGLKLFRAGDVEGGMADWADDVVIKLIGALPGQPDTLRGKAEARAWFESLLAAHFDIEEELIKEEGDTLTVKALTWIDQTRQLGIAPLEGTEVYVVKNGKIASYTWTISPESQAKLQAALARLSQL